MKHAAIDRPIGSNDSTPPPSELAQRLARPVLLFDLTEEVENLRQGRSWQDDGHNAKALVKHPDLRITLTLLKAGQRIPGHKTDARISVQTITGKVRLHLPGRTVDLPKGGLLALDRGVSHDVEAVEESAFLLTLSWPSGGKSQAEALPPINALKAGLILGAFTGTLHLAWSAVVAAGLAQRLLDSATQLHFLNNPFHVEPFAFGTALLLVAFTACAGFALGWLLAIVWNATDRYLGSAREVV